MKVNISGFYDEISSDLDRQIAAVKRYGESYMCPRIINGKNIADYSATEFASQIKPKFDVGKIKISSLGSPIGKIGLYDEEGYKRQLVQLGELVKIAKMTGCAYVRIFSFRVKADGDYDEYFPVVVSKIKGFLEVAAGSGVTLLHENEKRIYGDVPERVLQLYKAVDDPAFKLAFDASNYIQCGVDAKAAYDTLKDYTVYYHVKDCSPEKVEVPLGMGEGNYEYIFADLQKRGYEGFLTLEPHTAKYADRKLLFNYLGWALCCVPIIGKWRKVFRRIDKVKGVPFNKSVTREQVFDWQYHTLKKMLEEAQGE